MSWDTTPLGDGDYDLHVVTTDDAGNSVTSATRTVSVDNHAPTVSITAPGAYVNGAAADPFTVTATSPDTDIARGRVLRLLEPVARLLERLVELARRS